MGEACALPPITPQVQATHASQPSRWGRARQDGVT